MRLHFMFFKEIIYTGIRPQSRPSERRSIMLTNALCLIISGAVLMILMIRHFFASNSFAANLIMMAGAMLLPIVFNYFKRTGLSQITLSWLPVIFLFYIYITELTKMDSPSPAFYDALKIYLVGLSALPFLTLSLRNKVLYAVGVSVPVVGIIFCNSILELFHVGPEAKGFQDPELFFNGIRASISFLILSASCVALRRVVDLSEGLSEQRYQELFQVNPMPMFMLENHTLRFLDVNEAAIKHFGFTRQQFLNATVSLITHPKETNVLAEWLQNTENSVTHKVSIWRQRDAYGQALESEISCHRVNRQDTDVLALMIIDVTKQQAANRQIRQLATMIDTSSVVSRTSTKGTIIEANQNLLSLSEYTAEELVGQCYEILKSDGHEEVFWHELTATILAGKTWHGEVQNRSKSGHHFWTESYIYPICDTDGSILEFLTIGKDITARKEIENENKKLALIARHTTNAIIITNEKGEIEWVNDSFTRITEYTMTEVLGKIPGDLLQGEDTNRETVEHMKHAIDTGQGFHVEIINYTKSGRKYWLDIDCVPLYQQNKLTGFIAIEVDITGLKEAVHRIIESEDRFRMLTYELNVGVLLQGTHDEILFSNPAAHMLLGVTESQLLGKSSFDPDWQVIHSNGAPFLPDDRPSVKALQLKQSVSNIQMGVYRPVTRDWVWLLTSAVPLFDAHGEVKQVIVSFTNITKEKEYQKELIQSVEEKELLIKEIHHRVKNNLQLISSMLYLKMQRWDSPDAREFLASIREKIKSISLIHERLLQTETVDSIDIEDYVIKLLRNIQAAYNLPSTQLNIRIDIQHRFFTTDHALYLGQLINELVTNALKHAFAGMDTGEIRVTLEETNNTYTLQVHDNGIGLPPTQEAGKSTSFGMQLVDIFVNQLKGTLVIDRRQGTTFTIQFN